MEGLIELFCYSKGNQLIWKTFQSEDVAAFETEEDPWIKTSSNLVEFPLLQQKAQLSLRYYNNNTRCNSKFQCHLVTTKAELGRNRLSIVCTYVRQMMVS